MKKFAIIFVLYFIVSPASFALPEKPTSFAKNDLATAKKYLTEFIEDWMDDESIPGVSLALYSDDKMLWRQGFGFSDLENDIKARHDTIYRIGGVTTLFTAIAIMQLVDQGKLNLDEPLKKIVPEYTVKSHWVKNTPITIRHLLSHHSGLPITLYKGMWSKQPESNQQLLSRLSQTYTSYRPGEIYAFSNLGYALLGMVVERISGKNYQQFVLENIIKPFELTSTGFELTSEVKKRLATGYKKDEPKELLLPRDVAAMGLYSSVEDVAKLMQIFYNNTALLSLDSRRAMMISHFNPEINMGREVGFAWNMDDKRLYKVNLSLNRWGSTLMYRSRVMVLPDYGLTVVVMANSSKAFRALNEISVEVMRVALEVKEGIQHDLDKKQEEALAPVNRPTRFAERYMSLAGYATIQPKGDKDFVANLLGWDIHLKATENGWYSAQYDILGVLPIKLDWFAQVRVAPAIVADEPAVIVNFNGRNNIFGVPLPNAPISEEWRNRVGEYKVTNADELTEFYDVEPGRIWEKDGRLFFSYDFPILLPTTIDLPIIPINKDLAIIPGKGSAFNETVRIERSNGKERINFSGYLLEKVEKGSSWFF